ncbi:hypothetical protein G7Y79_00034g069530 [Physcia stellaris]|nr:hypothetical protein G7Y79_00034g069530 [Physcia stellaris]
MPKAAPRSNGPKASAHRAEPYTKSQPKTAIDKENVDPNSQTGKTPPHGDWRSIPLDEIAGEIPCYDDASIVRRKLKKLLSDKSVIPGTDGKKWTQAAMVAEMQELERRGHPVPYNVNASGPTARSLGGFLKKSGRMAGGDSPCYYWGYVLLEKMRVWKGEKKSKARERAEGEFPGGYCREDASKKRVSMPIGGPPPPGAWEPRGRGFAGPVAPRPLQPPELATGFQLPNTGVYSANAEIEPPTCPAGAKVFYV